MRSTYIVLGVALIIVIGGGYFVLNNKQAPKISTESPSSKNETSIKEEKADANMMGLGYIMKSGKMMVEENHQLSPMTEDVTLKDGTMVGISGTVTKKDGTSFTLAEGQSMWTDGTFMKEEAMKNDSASVTSSLSTRYTDYSPENFTKATANNGKTVLFFAALAWCPSCQAADRDFKAHFDKVPKDVTILKVDYDTAKDMKQKYAITMQDTFVQIDSQGKEITRWNSGGQGVEVLVVNVK